MDFLTAIVNNIDEALIVTDDRGEILFFNEVAMNLGQEILDRPLKRGNNVIEILSQTQKEVAPEIIKGLKLNQHAEKSFAECINRKGVMLYLEFNYIPVLNDDQELTHVHIFIRDITPQKIFEKKLTAQTANISNLIEKANAIIIGVDTRGYITDWNEYCSTITGYEKDEVYAQKFADVLLAKEETHFDDLLAKVLAYESVSNYEIPVHTKSGKQSIFLLNGTHRTASTREVVGVLFVGQDVTELTEYRRSLERKVAERTAELQQALKKEKEVVEMKSRFISIASHEFRTPLSSIEFTANFIKNNNQFLSKDKLISKLETIEKQVKHMTFLLDDVLTYGKSEAGKIQQVISTIDVVEFFNKIVEEVGISTHNTHTIAKEFIQLPEKMCTDEKLLRNILINLLTNAIKFSPGKPTVFLKVLAKDGQLMITVRDDGMGISHDELDRVFEAFVRGKAAGSIQGTGLGLSIVKKAVELLQGTLAVESEVSKGTIFNVKIPMQ